MGFPGVPMDSQTHGKITGTNLFQIQSLEEVALRQIVRSFSCLAYESGTWLISLTLMHQILKLKQGECQCCHYILAPKCEWEHFFWWFKSDVFRTSFHCSFFLRIYHLNTTCFRSSSKLTRVWNHHELFYAYGITICTEQLCQLMQSTLFTASFLWIHLCPQLSKVQMFWATSLMELVYQSLYGCGGLCLLQCWNLSCDDSSSKVIWLELFFEKWLHAASEFG